MSRKKFYTFAELSNYLSKLENNKKQGPDFEFWNNLYDEFGAWMVDNFGCDSVVEFMKYHRHNVGEGTNKLYPKKMWDIISILKNKYIIAK